MICPTWIDADLQRLAARQKISMATAIRFATNPKGMGVPDGWITFARWTWQPLCDRAMSTGEYACR